MGNYKSFNGFNIFRIEETISGEYECKTFLSKFRKKKFVIKKAKDCSFVRYVVAKNKENAIELFKELYIYPEIGEDFKMYATNRGLEKITAKVTNVNCDVEVDYYMTSKEMFEKLRADDYMKYMIFLKVGFEKIINPSISFNE